MSDFAARRTQMVDTQVRPSDVTKFPIIDAMLTVPREDFVPGALREAAYLGENLDLGAERVMLDPRTLAKMLDAIDISRDDLVLDVGAQLGYSSAVIARIAQAVVTLEDDASVSSEALDTLMQAGADNVITHTGPLVEGAAEHGPYDAIIIQGGVQQIPDTLTAQLKDGGRIAALFVEGALGEVRIGLRHDGHMSWRRVFNAGAPVLPGFETVTEFQL